jgi:hypothetical protein
LVSKFAFKWVNLHRYVVGAASAVTEVQKFVESVVVGAPVHVDSP